jgi:hypothetical protein
MKRRDFLRGTTAASLLSVLDPAYLAAKEQLTAGRTPQGTLERRKYGRTDDRLSIIGFGGIIVMNDNERKVAAEIASRSDPIFTRHA